MNICAYPAVPKNRCGLRRTITTHTVFDDIARLLASIAGAIKALK